MPSASHPIWHSNNSQTKTLEHVLQAEINSSKYFTEANHLIRQVIRLLEQENDPTTRIQLVAGLYNWISFDMRDHGTFTIPDAEAKHFLDSKIDAYEIASNELRKATVRYGLQCNMRYPNGYLNKADETYINIALPYHKALFLTMGQEGFILPQTAFTACDNPSLVDKPFPLVYNHRVELGLEDAFNNTVFNNTSKPVPRFAGFSPT